MFTRYKGISIPENYSGNRFKAPPQTETKMHRPSPSYTGTKTSLSPMFEEAMRQKSVAIPNQSQFNDEEGNDFDIGIDLPNEENSEESKVPLDNKEASDTYYENTTSKKSASGNSVLGELSTLIGNLTKGLKSEDLLILAIIVLLLSENNDDGMIILPLLFLLLYN